MLRICTKNSTVINKRALYRAAKYNTSSANDHANKIYALPFKLSEEKVHEIVNMASYVNQHAFFSIFKIIKSIFTQKMPDVKEAVSSMQVRKAYIPFWYYDMAISADVKPSTTKKESPEALMKAMGPPRQMLGIGFDCYWPGHAWDPVSFLSFGHSITTRMETLVPFTSDLHQDNDIEVIPFSVDPLKDITDRAPQALEGLTVNSLTHRHGMYTINNAQVLFNAAYPIYWPVYIAQFTDNKKETEAPTNTVVIGAQSNDPPFYQWDSKKSGAEQWINNGPWLKLDVTEPEWQMGFGNQPPLRQLVQRFLTQVVGEFQTNSVNWDDDRIQAYPNYESQNKDYLKQLFKVWAERYMLTRIEGMDDNQKAIGLGANDSSSNRSRLQVKTVSEIRKEIESRVGDELAKLEELEPVWFKEYNKKKHQ